MSDYSKTTDFAIKDSLLEGDPNKIVKGTEIDNEFNAIQQASGTKLNKVAGLSQDGFVAALDAAGNVVSGEHLVVETLKPYYCLAYRASATSPILASTWTNISFGNEIIDEVGIHDAAGSPALFSFAAFDWFKCKWGVEVTGCSVGDQVRIAITDALGGYHTDIEYQQTDAASGSTHILNGGTPWIRAVPAQCIIRVWHNSSNEVRAGDLSTWISVEVV